jgi:predicted NBD/HSP70 family sugar kinase
LCYAPNLKWKNIDFKEVFGEKDFEIMVENDSKLSLLAESFYSSDIKNSSNAFFLYLGEGVGGAIFINGRMIRGMNSAAGEIGNTLLRICDGLVEVEKLLSIANLKEEYNRGRRDAQR